MNACRHAWTWIALAAVAVAPAAAQPKPAPPPAAAADQPLWELEPYAVGLLVVADRSPEFAGSLTAELASGAQARLDALVGSTWRVARLSCDPALAQSLLGAAAATFPPESIYEELPADWRKLDKLLVLSLRTLGGGTRLSARELDLRVKAWSPPVERWVAQRFSLASEAAEASLAAFAPLARIETQDKGIVLRFKAARVPPRDPGIRFVEAGDLFQPFVRTANRDGTTRRVQPIPWTFLEAKESTAEGWKATSASGIHNPLSAKRRGRADQLALRIRIHPAPTVLKLRSRTDPEKPLVGYEVFAVGATPQETKLLGASDASGELTVAPAGDALRMLVIKHGGLLLARVPIVPGWRPSETIPIPDDDIRLEYEGQIVGLQEEIVDHVARRGALVLQTRARLDAGQKEEAKRVYERLRRLPSQVEYASRLAQLRTQITAAQLKDPQTKARISQMLVDTEKVLNTYLLEDELRELDKELRAK